MKRIKLSLIALFPLLCFGAANDIRVSQKNATDSAWVDRIFAPATGGAFGNVSGFRSAIGAVSGNAAIVGNYTITLSGNVSYTGAFNTIWAQTGNVNLTLPSSSTTLVGRDTTDNLTNKSNISAASGTALTLSGGSTSGNVVVNTNGSTQAALFSGSDETVYGNLFVDSKSVKASGIWGRYGTIVYGQNSWEEGTAQEPNILYDTNPQILGTPYVFKLWYSTGVTHGYLGYAESSDGISWTKKNTPVNLTHVHASVLKSGATYYMFAFSSGAIDRLTSADGISWTVTNSAVISPGPSSYDSAGVWNNYVWIEGPTWYMLYDGIPPSGNLYQVCLATSSDLGVTWTKSASNPVIIPQTPGAGVSGAFVQKVGSKYYAWCQESASGATPTDIFRYTSSNLTTWARTPSASVFYRTSVDEGTLVNDGQVADVSMVEVSGNTYMVYGAYSTPGQAYGHVKIAVAPMTIAQLVSTNEGVANPGAGIESNPNFFWDDFHIALGLGTSTPGHMVGGFDTTGSGVIQIVGRSGADAKAILSAGSSGSAHMFLENQLGTAGHRVIDFVHGSDNLTIKSVSEVDGTGGKNFISWNATTGVGTITTTGATTVLNLFGDTGYNSALQLGANGSGAISQLFTNSSTTYLDGSGSLILRNTIGGTNTATLDGSQLAVATNLNVTNGSITVTNGATYKPLSVISSDGAIASAIFKNTSNVTPTEWRMGAVGTSGYVGASGNDFAISAGGTAVLSANPTTTKLYNNLDISGTGASSTAGSWTVAKVSATTPSALTYASPTSVDVTLANVFTVTTVNATGSVTFNATAGGTAGATYTFIITNDATSAKTITFGTNFVANGTLTPSGVGKVATIRFISNGTSLYELCRTVLP